MVCLLVVCCIVEFYCTAVVWCLLIAVDYFGFSNVGLGILRLAEFCCLYIIDFLGV